MLTKLSKLKPGDTFMTGDFGPARTFYKVEHFDLPFVHCAKMCGDVALNEPVVIWSADARVHI
jgi:hypothetical protein